VNIVWAVVALSVLSTILTFVYLDELVEAVDTNLTGAERDAARAGGIAGGIIGFVVFGVLWVVLGIYLRKGANWARIVLTVLAVLGVLFGLYGLLAGNQPIALLVLGLIQMVLFVALLYFLWRRESTEYIKAHRGS